MTVRTQVRRISIMGSDGPRQQCFEGGCQAVRLLVEEIRGCDWCYATYKDPSGTGAVHCYAEIFWGRS